MRDYNLLFLACLAFIGSHFILSHPLRPALSRFFKEPVFLIFYSLVAFATFGWAMWEFVNAPKLTPLWTVGDIGWGVASLLTLIASVLFVGSFSGNPSLPNPEAGKLAAREPHGVFLVTRHPMMWGFALWGAAHILVAPRPDVFIFIGSIVFLALVGAKTQEMKKTRMMGVEWDMWRRKTSYWPRLGGLLHAGWWPWVGGIALWLVATYAHPAMNWPVVGIWRWVGG